MLRRTLLIGFALGCLLGVVTPGQACSCMALPADPQQALAQTWHYYEMVFAGVADGSKHGRWPSTKQRTRFTVDKVWKGPTHQTEVVIENFHNEASCGISFKRGQRYLVFASRLNNGMLTTTFCDPTRLETARWRNSLDRFVIQQATAQPPR